jgi:Winged helix-turn-helix
MSATDQNVVSCHEAFLSFSQLEEYFPLLLRNGLLGIKKTYKITGKGLHVLELCNSLDHMIDARKTNKEEKNSIRYELNSMS